MIKTITRALLKRRVKRGAKLLDEKMPNWYKTVGASIFNGSFRMSSWSSCVCGQLEIIDWQYGKRGASVPVIAINGVELVGYHKASSYGFYFDDSTEEIENGLAPYTVLGNLWRDQVDQRLTVSEAKALGMHS